MDNADTDADDWQALWHHLHEALGGKWALHVLRLLSERDAGFNEIRRELGGVTAKTLSTRLDELRCRGFVSRTVVATSPPRTRYALTPAGERFVSVLREVEPLVSVVDCDCNGVENCDVLTVDADATATCVEGC
ncbi:HxlR family transcriptional regulator [Haloprofundus marisrubri]|uniref:HxlR family transcriptional regulator n=1 Tax=Haloprofundus marisrubri TaxID=1514971 RepID=A0A0W1RAB3_9EURY|nr:helix-turn-helix domain-containing protein [Haloprofundus marisrubri]KTG10018.1 HxlR family transcriptional regulator [Haloprofundus marisrubri]